MKKIILVTGSTSGIGKAISKKFLENGFSVLGFGRNRQTLEQLTKEAPSNFEGFECEFSPETNWTAVSNRLKELSENGEIIGLVNNAGIFDQKSFEDSGQKDLARMFQTNFFSAWELTRVALPALRKNATKHYSFILNISSTLGLRSVPSTSAYSASKAAMNSWAQTLALELAPQVRVNSLCPGLVETPIHSFYQSSVDDPLRKEMNKAQPLKRVGTPKDIADFAYFVSVDSPWMTGSLLTLDGGISL